MKRQNEQENLKIAGRQYEVEDYQRNDTLSAGLAVTHEQVSDAYTEGEINPVIDNQQDGSETRIPRKGYQ
ncbi:hypothetical protein WQ57_11530 [Mesobacillus campisalis]|uniref:DUF4025 domain-containing protein n=1 Tax=Mesobacillus campisalis TaxID=1408103 RepID=A0A0M2SXU0_9BACI|nr:YozQ family protein [Mesobacillus campisalis]KKK37802.1 hypothetical protein WQ57_11530 [Mesobacillus campisalis]